MDVINGWPLICAVADPGHLVRGRFMAMNSRMKSGWGKVQRVSKEEWVLTLGSDYEQEHKTFKAMC